LRGTGLTHGRGASFGMAQLAADLFELTEALALPRFHLVGHSLGGAIAMQFALDYPERVKSLVLVAPAPAAGLSAMRRGASRFARMLSFVDPDHEPSMAFLSGSTRFGRAIGTHRSLVRQSLEAMLPARLLELDAFVDDALAITPEATVGYLQGLNRWNV